MEEPDRHKLEIIPKIENSTFLAHIVEFGIELLILFAIYDIIDITFEQSFQKEGKRSEKQIIERNIEIIVISLSTETAEKREIELRQGEDHIFVEKIENKLWISQIIQSSMN